MKILVVGVPFFILALQASVIFAEILYPDELAAMIKAIRNNKTQLLRAYDSAKINNRYYLTEQARKADLTKIKTLKAAGDIGYVVSDAFYKDHVQPQCKLMMKKMNVYYHKTNRRVEIVGNTLPAKTHTWHNSFWCANSRGYCGADWELQYIIRRPCLNQWKDYFYPKNQSEREKYLKEDENYGKTYTSTGCYIWSE